MKRAAWIFGLMILSAASASAAEVSLRQHTIEEPWGSGVIQVADMDGDKDYDFIAITETGLSWFENAERGKKYVAHEIEKTVAAANVAMPADMDGDGDLDLVTHAQFFGREIAWSENQGKGKPWPKHAMLDGDAGSEVKVLTLADADGDRDLDLIVAGRGSQWLANQDGKGTKWEALAAVGNIESEIGAIALVDLDGDGDNDAVAAAKDRKELIACENAGKSWNEPRVLQKVEHAALLPADIQTLDSDKDGDIDLLGAAPTGQIVLYDNADGKGGVVENVLTKILGLEMARPADLDGDGDFDVVSASEDVQWLEIEGAKLVKQHDVLLGWERPTVLAAVDFEGDGDVDIVSVSNDIDGKRTAWWENLRQ